jgi:excisionase family DNA binding protein
MATKTPAAYASNPEEDADIVRRLAEALAEVKDGSPDISIEINGVREPIPHAALAVLKKAVNFLAHGHPVDVVTTDREMSVQEAATLLGVSRPYVMNLLNRGILPYRKVGVHHRIPAEAVSAFQREQEPRRRTALDALAAETQTLGH